MSEEQKAAQCVECGGVLADLDDYVMWRSIRTGLASAAAAAAICGMWAPVFFLVRLGVGGALGDAGAGALALLVIKKILVGVVIGLLLGVAIAVGRNELGLFLGAVIGSLGGFFVAAAEVMPLRSDAAHRLDVVLVSVLAGILCVATVQAAHGYAGKRFGTWIGPEPRAGDKKSD